MVGIAPRPSSHQLVRTVAWKIGERTEYALESAPHWDLFARGLVTSG
jgi:glycerol kinase